MPESMTTGRTTSPIFILAGNYEQAGNAARELPRSQRWRYVSDGQQLLGVHGGTFTIVGTFWERHDAREIYDTARAAGLEEA